MQNKCQTEKKDLYRELFKIARWKRSANAASLTLFKKKTPT
jgi:hypothetical protein